MCVLPTQRALWIPAGIAHKVRMSGTVSSRNLYLRCNLAQSLPCVCSVVNISPLLKELILHACQFPTLNRRTKGQRHFIGLLLNLLHSSQLLPLQLPQPTDPRARKLASLFLSDPTNSVPVRDPCRRAGASKRTIERLFRRDTQMTLGRWRQQLRLIHGMRLIAQGMKITSVAVETGYSSPSAFISMFKKLLGTTPGLYFRANSAASAPSRARAS
jgi:AraC-like DNA-binding protein